MKGFSQIAFGIVIGIVTAAMFTPRPAPQPELWPHPAVQYADPPQESAPVVDLVPAHEAKAEPATGVPDSTTSPNISQNDVAGRDGLPADKQPVPTEAAQADSGVEPKLPDVPPESVPLQDKGGNLARLRAAIASYRDSYGVRWYVYGQTEQQHLVQAHGWKPEQIEGLTEDELHLLHGMSHTGRINPADFAAVQSGAEAKGSSAPGDSRISVRVISPATWDCPHCPGHRNQDWNSAGIDATFEKRDGLPKYPCTEWTDSRGVTRRLYGVRTPKQVRWSWEHAQ